MSLAPVGERERIQSLDVIRGFAVLGILAVNAQFFAAPWQAGLNPLLAPLGVTESTQWSWTLMHVLFEMKCITLFSMLFGVSVYLVGGEREDNARGALLRRRLLWLGAFGLVHALLIWYGDVLVSYAVAGAIVMLARSLRAPALLAIGIALNLGWLVPEGAGVASLSILSSQDLASFEESIWTPPEEEMARITAAYRGDVLGATLENAQTWWTFWASNLLFVFTRLVGLMLIGLGLFKLGFLRGASPSWVYAVSMLIGAGALGAIYWQAQVNLELGAGFTQMLGMGRIANLALSAFAALGYAGALVLLVRAGAAFITRPLAAAGRMAFTNYLTQSLIMTSLFWGGRGLGWFGELDRVSLWGVVVAIWVVQLIWSPLWLSKFEMGPFEWVWRRLSYSGPAPRLIRRSN